MNDFGIHLAVWVWLAGSAMPVIVCTHPLFDDWVDEFKVFSRDNFDGNDTACAIYFAVICFFWPVILLRAIVRRAMF